jgi:uncharacterized repeat protein (TIGR01451 family)
MRRGFLTAATFLGLALSPLGVTTSAAQVPPNADLAIVSNTASARHIKAGQTVKFTIEAVNNGPDAVDFNVDAARDFGTADSLCYRAAFIDINPGSDGFFNEDGPTCEYGLVQPGEEVSMFITSDALPDLYTTGKRVSVKACVVSFIGVPPLNDPNPANDCATASVKIVGKRSVSRKGA